ncbi:MAG: HTH domain-containing protein [Comamonas sp.]
MSERLTQAQLARELGVSRQAIHKHVVAGTLAMGEDGKIDLDAARAAMQTLHPGAKTVQALVAGSAPTTPAPAAAPEPSHVVIPAQATHFLGDADERGMPTSYHVARTLRETEEARIAKLKREEMEGLLIRVSAVEAAWAASLAAVREHLLQLRARLAPLLAAENDPLKIDAMLGEEHAQALQQLAGCSVADVPQEEGAS